MAENQVLKRIGRRLREESRDIVEARLPERLRAMVDRLARVEERDRDLNDGHTAH